MISCDVSVIAHIFVEGAPSSLPTPLRGYLGRRRFPVADHAVVRAVPRMTNLNSE